jgi:hypothetical protein
MLSAVLFACLIQFPIIQTFILIKGIAGRPEMLLSVSRAATIMGLHNLLPRGVALADLNFKFAYLEELRLLPKTFFTDFATSEQLEQMQGALKKYNHGESEDYKMIMAILEERLGEIQRTASQEINIRKCSSLNNAHNPVGSINSDLRRVAELEQSGESEEEDSLLADSLKYSSSDDKAVSVSESEDMVFLFEDAELFGHDPKNSDLFTTHSHPCTKRRGHD